MGAGDGSALEFEGARRSAGDHDGAGLLLEPAEGRDVVVAAVQDAELAGAGLAGPVRGPRGEPVARLVGEQAYHGRHEAVRRRLCEHVVAHAVELEEHDPGRAAAAPVGGLRRTAASAAPVGEAGESSPVRVVVADRECRGGRGGDGRHDGRHDDGGLRVGVPAPVRDEPQGDEQQRAVEEEDEGAQHQGGHDEQGSDEHRPHQGGQQAEGARAPGRGEGGPGDGVAVVGLELEVGEDPRQRQHGERGDGPHRDHAYEGSPRLAPSPVVHAVPPHVRARCPSWARVKPVIAPSGSCRAPGPLRASAAVVSCGRHGEPAVDARLGARGVDGLLQAG